MNTIRVPNSLDPGQAQQNFGHDTGPNCLMTKIRSYIVLSNSPLLPIASNIEGAQWLKGRVLDSRPRGRGLEPHRRHCVVSLSKNINLSLVLVQPKKTRPFITERLLMGRK